jgi:hypothetical protein
MITAIFVSKRLHRAAAVFLCVIVALFTIALASCDGDLAPMAVRTALTE